MSELAQAVADLKEDDIKRIVGEQLDAGTPANDILKDCQSGLAAVGNRFEAGDYFISELMYAGEIMKDLMKDLGPRLQDTSTADAETRTVVLGTVAGDIHDIGKDVVALMLRGAGYKVVDLGVDVPPAKFGEAVTQHKPIMVGMSVFLTTCCKALDQTVAAIRETGLRDTLSIMIGGAAASDFVAERTGCDCYGATAVDAVKLTDSAAG